MSEFSAKRYPAIFLLLAIVAGIILADFLDISIWIYLIVAAALFPLIISLYYHQRIFRAGVIGLLSLLIISAANFSYRYKAFPRGHIMEFADDDMNHIIYGTVDDWPNADPGKVDLIVAVDSVETAGTVQRGFGKLILRINSPSSRFQYADRIIFESRIYSLKGGKNYSGFDYRRYLNLKGIFASAYLPNQYSIQIDPISDRHFYRLISEIRHSIMNIFQENLEPESAAMAGGFLIGEIRGIDPKIYNLFRDSGTLHLLAVSGSNVALVILVIAFILKGSGLRIWKRSAILIAIIFLFSFLSYNQPSVIRAAVMAGLLIIGRAFQRRIEYNNIIAAAASLILIFEPTQLFDVGFQLSFITAWGMIYIAPKFSLLFKSILAKWYYKFLIWPFLICLIAQFFSMPLSSYYFHRIPLIGFLSNLVIVPLVSITVVGELILLFVSSIFTAGGQFVGALLNPLFTLTIILLRSFSSSTGQLLSLPQLSSILLIAIYLFLLMAGAAFRHKSFRRLAIIYTLVVLNIGLFIGLFERIPGSRIKIFHNPGGLLAIVESGSSHLIISGLPRRDYAITEKVIIPDLQDRKIPKTDIFALSSDYQTLNEAITLQMGGYTDKLFIPLEGRALFLDQFGTLSPDAATPSVVYYGPNDTIPDLEIPYGHLSEGQICYKFGAAKVLLTLDLSCALNLVLDGQGDSAIDAIVTPRLLLQDTLAFEKEFICKSKFVICSWVDDNFKNWYEARKTATGLDGPIIINTSEVGSAELVTGKRGFEVSN